jgi:hypothetical protein
MAIATELAGVNDRMDKLEAAMSALTAELMRHRQAETVHRVTTGALPWAAMLLAIAALAVSVYRMGEPIVVNLSQPTLTVWR